MFLLWSIDPISVISPRSKISLPACRSIKRPLYVVEVGSVMVLNSEELSVSASRGTSVWRVVRRSSRKSGTQFTTSVLKEAKGRPLGLTKRCISTSFSLMRGRTPYLTLPLPRRCSLVASTRPSRPQRAAYRSSPDCGISEREKRSRRLYDPIDLLSPVSREESFGGLCEYFHYCIDVRTYQI